MNRETVALRRQLRTLTACTVAMLIGYGLGSVGVAVADELSRNAGKVQGPNKVGTASDTNPVQVGGLDLDGGTKAARYTASGAATTTEPMLTALPDGVVQVGLTAVPIPTINASRTGIEICNSSENAAVVLIKCITDGALDAGLPVLGPGNKGGALAVGQCFQARAPGSMVPYCVSNTAAVAGGGGAFVSYREAVQ